MMNILKDYKGKVSKLRNSKNFISRSFYSINKFCYVVFHIIIKSSYREQFISRTIFNKHFHQISHYTEINRYPDLFQICKVYLKDNPKPKILSFGCSTGEEVISIGLYIPNAIIIGTDISLWCIRECRKKLKNEKFIFVHSLSKYFRLQENFDAIFCLAVFQRPENRIYKNIEFSTKYLFDKFDKQVNILDKKLKPGGVLVIDNCDFDFLETKTALNYHVLEVPNNRLIQERPLFNKFNKKISSTSITFRVFVKSNS